MALTLTSSQIDQLKLRDNVRFLIRHILLVYWERKDAMRSAWAIVHAVAWHYFVFKTFPEVLKSFLLVFTFKNEHIFNNCFLCQRVQFKFKTSWHLLRLLSHCLLGFRVKKIKYFFVIELNVLAINSNLTVAFFQPFCFNLFKKVMNRPKDKTIIFRWNINDRTNLLNIISSLFVLVALHGVSLATACLAIYKDSCVESEHHLLNQVVYSHSFVNRLLISVAVENLVKSKLLLLSSHIDLSISSDSYGLVVNYLQKLWIVSEPSKRFLSENRPDPNSYFYIACFH